MEELKKRIVMDFDGVFHPHFKGSMDVKIINEEPIEGIKEFLERLVKDGWEIHICSTRALTLEGQNAIIKWLRKHSLVEYIDRISSIKSPALVYLDDRGVRFNGKFDEKLYEEITNFKPYHIPSEDAPNINLTSEEFNMILRLVTKKHAEIMDDLFRIKNIKTVDMFSIFNTKREDILSKEQISELERMRKEKKKKAAILLGIIKKFA